MENFIEDILNQLVKEANEIKPLDEFEKGKLFGYYYTISHIMNQAESFGIFDKLSQKLQAFRPESLIKG
ncbi:MAG: hypothetical protein EOO20_13370 [Chryseobacterium sp.]|nr:MAG: hypothetical protein EOO20_13370 [Chryseobacterium sp.]